MCNSKGIRKFTLYQLQWPLANRVRGQPEYRGEAFARVIKGSIAGSLVKDRFYSGYFVHNPLPFLF